MQIKRKRNNLRSRRQDLRRRQTMTEAKLWPALRVLRKSGFVFRRQHSIGPYIADFYCPKVHLVIEVDGGIHEKESQRAYDKERDRYMEALDLKVVRIKNQEIEEDMQKVMLKIMAAAGLYQP